jgi:uncharacterized protein YbjT (DUF2867 family)
MLLLTGATGYIGGRLLLRLEAEKRQVRCLCRNPDALQSRVAPGTQVVSGDLNDAESLHKAMEGVHTAYYLVHSLGESGAFEDEERTNAERFGAAAAGAGIRRIIYLGGLAEPGDLSPHMRSRMATGEILRSSGVPVIEFRASIVIGSGSASFEMIRSLVEHLPVMVTPRWVDTPAQPIAIEDLIDYLANALSLPEGGHQIFEIGGAEVTPYAGIMREYAKKRELKRWIVRVPFLTPWLSSLWLGLVTPLYARIGRRLIESVRHPSIVRDPSARTTFSIQPMGISRAIDRALAYEDHEFARTRWSDARSASGWRASAPPPTTGNRFVDSRKIRVPLPAKECFRPIRRIGGSVGWYYGNRLWRFRGFLDVLAGGVGMRRGRPDPEHPFPGSTLDFWRVEAYEADQRLRLAAEMKVPGRAWLELSVEPDGDGTIIHQKAEFEPRGLAGLLYWYALYPIHQFIFAGMLRRLAAAAKEG